MNTEDLPDTHGTSVRPPRVGVAVVLFAGIAVLIGADLLSDSQTGVDPLHLAGEALVMVLAVTGVLALWRSLVTAEARVARLDDDLHAARAEAARFRQEAGDALRGLGEAIDSQFERWALTPAEREVGLLLLKGLSHKEIADLRSTGEATVRQQALLVYRKSGLRNRSDLSAFFLEDLLLPRPSPQ